MRATKGGMVANFVFYLIYLTSIIYGSYYQAAVKWEAVRNRKQVSIPPAFVNSLAVGSFSTFSGVSTSRMFTHGLPYIHTVPQVASLRFELCSNLVDLAIFEAQHTNYYEEGLVLVAAHTCNVYKYRVSLDELTHLVVLALSMVARSANFSSPQLGSLNSALSDSDWRYGVLAGRLLCFPLRPLVSLFVVSQSIRRLVAPTLFWNSFPATRICALGSGVRSTPLSFICPLE